jgi:tRNA (cmo5U34)-methyltransferase
MKEKDSIYTSPVGEIEPFKFDETVAKVFPDMIVRSVPGYNTIISAIGLLAEKFAQPDSICYDLGCSLGAATLSMRHHIAEKYCRIIAVDNSQAMLQHCEKLIAQDHSQIDVELQCSDIRNISIVDASVVVINFTLQFIPINDRQELLNNIYQGLLPGGILIISEKISFDDSQQQALQTEMHHIFKKANGYSDLEISQKRTALENVLIPETFKQHQQRLLNAGFNSAEIWFQYFNFASMLALK